jgi:hypothetical protein
MMIGTTQRPVTRDLERAGVHFERDEHLIQDRLEIWTAPTAASGRVVQIRTATF